MSIAAACLLVAVIGEGASGVLRWGIEPASDIVLWAVYNVAVTAIGGFIVHRQPRHPVGWIFLVLGTFGILTTETLVGYGMRAEASGWPGAAQGQYLGQVAWCTGALLWILALYFIPTGRLPGPRWRAGVVAAVGGAGLYVAGWLLDPASFLPDTSLKNPFGVVGSPAKIFLAGGNVLLAAGALAAFASVFARWRHADQVVRQQLKWVAVAGVFQAAFMPIGLLFWSTTPFVRDITPVVLLGSVLALTAAVLRYRLFDLDVLILRGAALTIAAVLGVALYAGVVITLGAVAGGSRPWQTAAATLAAVLVFRPVARVAQGMLNRRFDRDHDGLVTLDRYLDGLRAGTETSERFETVLREATRVPSLRLLLHLPASGEYADATGRTAQPAPGRAVVGIEQEVLVEYDGPPDPAVTARIVRFVRHAGLAIQVSRLSIDLNRQVDELAVSRQRITVVADGERRRIQRNLHDGAQQRMVTVGIALRGLESRLRRRGEADDADRIDALVADLGATIEELRALTGDLPLPQLDAGIGAAFRELAQRSPIPVTVEVPADRLAAPIEATAYFVGYEGLTNSLKHARASAVVLRAERKDGSLVVSVRDDGVGGADPASGSGLVGLDDRVAAMGGRLRIDSGSTGTLLTAVLPCA